MNQKYLYAIILDFEATCGYPEPVRPQEIIEFPSVLVLLETMEIVDEFNSFVSPYHNPHLTEFCRNLTSIGQADVDDALRFHDVLASHGKWLEKHGLTEMNSIFVTCGDWDLRTMLPAQCRIGQHPVEALYPIYTRWLNIKVPYAELLKRKAPGMAGMMRCLGLPLIGVHHRGIDDCRNIQKILGALVSRGASIEVTSRLPMEQFPPIHLCLHFGDTIVSVILSVRSLRKLRGIAGRCFRCQIRTITRLDGTSIEENDQLLLLRPGEVLVLA